MHDPDLLLQVYADVIRAGHNYQPGKRFVRLKQLVFKYFPLSQIWFYDTLSAAAHKGALQWTEVYKLPEIKRIRIIGSAEDTEDWSNGKIKLWTRENYYDRCHIQVNLAKWLVHDYLIPGRLPHFIGAHQFGIALCHELTHFAQYSKAYANFRPGGSLGLKVFGSKVTARGRDYFMAPSEVDAFAVMAGLDLLFAATKGFQIPIDRDLALNELRYSDVNLTMTSILPYHIIHRRSKDYKKQKVWRKVCKKAYKYFDEFSKRYTDGFTEKDMESKT